MTEDEKFLCLNAQIEIISRERAFLKYKVDSIDNLLKDAYDALHFNTPYIKGAIQRIGMARYNISKEINKLDIKEKENLFPRQEKEIMDKAKNIKSMLGKEIIIYPTDNVLVKSYKKYSIYFILRHRYDDNGKTRGFVHFVWVVLKSKKGWFLSPHIFKDYNNAIEMLNNTGKKSLGPWIPFKDAPRLKKRINLEGIMKMTNGWYVERFDVEEKTAKEYKS